MTFFGKHEAGVGQTLGIERLDQSFRLRRAHDLVLQTLENDHGSRQSIRMMDRRPLPIAFDRFGQWSDEPVHIARLEFVGILGESFQIGDAVVAGASGKHVMENQRAEGCQPARAPAANRHSLRIHHSVFSQVSGRVDTIVDIDDAPLPVQPFPVHSSVSGAAAIVDIDDGKTAACPELNRKVEPG